MQISVHSRKEIEAGLDVSTDYLIISIHDPDQPPASIKPDPALRGILVLAFDDSDPCARAGTPPNAQPMTRAHATQIRDFLQQHPGIPTLLIHCEQGMSRSPAVAAAISDALHLDPRRFHQLYTPNQHVYQTLAEVFDAAPLSP